MADAPLGSAGVRAIVGLSAWVAGAALLVGCGTTAPRMTGSTAAPPSTGSSTTTAAPSTSAPSTTAPAASTMTTSPGTLRLSAPSTIEQHGGFTVRSIDSCPLGRGAEVSVTVHMFGYVAPLAAGTADVGPSGEWTVTAYLEEPSQPGPATVTATCGRGEGPPTAGSAAYYRPVGATVVPGGSGAPFEAPSSADAGQTITVRGLVACPSPGSDFGAVWILPPGQYEPAATSKVYAYLSNHDEFDTGAWRVDLPIPATVTPGRYQLVVECINRGGIDLHYTRKSLTITPS